MLVTLRSNLLASMARRKIQANQSSQWADRFDAKLADTSLARLGLTGRDKDKDKDKDKT